MNLICLCTGSEMLVWMVVLHYSKSVVWVPQVIRSSRRPFKIWARIRVGMPWADRKSYRQIRWENSILQVKFIGDTYSQTFVSKSTILARLSSEAQLVCGNSIKLSQHSVCEAYIFTPNSCQNQILTYEFVKLWRILKCISHELQLRCRRSVKSQLDFALLKITIDKLDLSSGILDAMIMRMTWIVNEVRFRSYGLGRYGVWSWHNAGLLLHCLVALACDRQPICLLRLSYDCLLFINWNVLIN